MQQLKIEKTIAKSPKEVFKSLKEGRLFMNCSADSNDMEIDFRVGGKYKLNFKNHKVSNWGEFLEIIPDQKIVFSWCQTFDLDQKPDTKVTIELFSEGDKTRLVLQHSGFKDQSVCDNHYQGWNAGITDLTSELEAGTIRLLRRYEVPVEKLYGTFLECSLKQEMTLHKNITLRFSVKDESNSSLEIIHEGLATDKEQMMGRNNWDVLTTKISGSLK